MQFSTVAIFASAVAAVSTVVETSKTSTLVTITSCGPEVTDCPAHHSSASNHTSANVTTYEGAAGKQYAAGAVALAAGALLALPCRRSLTSACVDAQPSSALRPMRVTHTMAPLSDESKAFHHAVFSAVGQVPYGKVTSYGHIAYLIGRPQNARQVGSALKNSHAVLAIFRNEGVIFPPLPWWRVISSSGLISSRDSGMAEQKENLRRENVDVEGMSVDLSLYGWFPDEIDEY